MPTPTGDLTADAPGSSARVLVRLSVVSWICFALLLAVRPRPVAYDVRIDAGAYNLPFLLSAVTCGVRARAGGAERRGWGAMAVALGLFTAANCYGSVIVGDRDIYPSPADGLWLAFYLAAYVSIVLLVHARARRLTGAVWLDGAIAGTGAAALVAVLALDPVLHLTDGDLAEVVTNIAYPVADVLLIVVLVAAGYATRTRSRAWWTLGLGLAVMCVGDILFLFQEASDTYQEGSWIDLSWPLAAVVIAVAAAMPPAAVADEPAPERSFVVPGIFTAVSIGLLALAGHTISMGVGLFAAVTLVLAAVRTILTVREVSALAHSRVEARTDELTGLANRRRLIEALDAGVEAGAPIGLVLIDLDRFKVVNDSLGHAAGDHLLVEVANRLRNALPPDVVLARLGGDEFAAVVPGDDPTTAEAIAVRCRDALAAAVVIEGIDLRVDASIGVALTDRHARTRDELLAGADVAMYRAKRERTGIEVFSAAERAISRRPLAMLADLRSALVAHDLDLHYQPRLDLRTGEVDGVEALVRWHHPELGLIGPADFLPLVVDAGLGAELLEFVAARSARDLRHLRRLGHGGVRMSINVFAADLTSTGLLDVLWRHFDGGGLALADVTVEVTEDALAARPGWEPIVGRFRAAGGRISMDDFGTGHASLSRIRELPLDELKLDRSFVASLPTERDGAAIVEATIRLAHALDLPMVAEGVETEAALTWLRDVGCDVAQGYHVAPPLPLERLIAWLAGRGVTSDRITGVEANDARMMAATPPG